MKFTMPTSLTQWILQEDAWVMNWNKKAHIIQAFASAETVFSKHPNYTLNRNSLIGYQDKEIYNAHFINTMDSSTRCLSHELKQEFIPVQRTFESGNTLSIDEHLSRNRSAHQAWAVAIVAGSWKRVQSFYRRGVSLLQWHHSCSSTSRFRQLEVEFAELCFLGFLAIFRWDMTNSENRSLPDYIFCHSNSVFW